MIFYGFMVQYGESNSPPFVVFRKRRPWSLGVNEKKKEKPNDKKGFFSDCCMHQDTTQEVVIPHFAGRKVLVFSAFRFFLALSLLATESVQQQNCIEAYHILQLG